jgi:hypothetical protein
MKYDNDKIPMALVPAEAIEKVAKVLSFGATKYGANNWRDDGHSTPYTRTYSSILRHLSAWSKGEDIDPESGQEHLAHATTQLMILMIHQAEHPESDDRYNTTRKTS